eukprot:CAMPEP_0170130674 /NCGR_PEP_ID=MMETSP0020_2-20130122/22749_1 /TAXON_ID=98059 /ORGANISM="Dinobryon sp., Strain UTEXLB2267" /LENGTH=100 /DNA_ID=CAMNT_0010365515 /DNA_START=5557 /DNA_END=5859 /DNA_ORIENTATION=-
MESDLVDVLVAATVEWRGVLMAIGGVVEMVVQWDPGRVRKMEIRLAVGSELRKDAIEAALRVLKRGSVHVGWTDAKMVAHSALQMDYSMDRIAAAWMDPN